MAGIIEFSGKVRKRLASVYEKVYREKITMKRKAITPPPEAKLITIPKQTITAGHDDNEYKDDDGDEYYNLSKAFGWDNESPRREINVESFKIHSRPVTNGEYLVFMRATVNKEYSGSWIPIDPQFFEYKVGAVKMNVALNLPVTIITNGFIKHGFKNWCPVDVPSNSDLIQALRSGWEWRSSEFDKYPGFK
ncbi:10975_t:CDS:2 [Entrophospora sp. SA101]|nr:4721_t:CDS:2 [Entrophospora sp. SA101]CAJ0640740.1 10975_t:CDS:2 [Entrophospora sp. SA101]